MTKIRRKDGAAVRIGVVADYSSTNRFHVATNKSLQHAAEALNLEVEPVWFDTDKLDSDSVERQLAECDGIFAGCSPYRSVEGALRGIRFAREQGWPFIAT